MLCSAGSFSAYVIMNCALQDCFSQIYVNSLKCFTELFFLFASFFPFFFFLLFFFSLKTNFSHVS